ncbi:MAG: bifunctional oligoribonuclease/PAP phosphatase NrnA [Fimbriimonadales bacterium]
MSHPIQELKEAIGAAQSIVIAGHKGPDGDCIGAGLALRNALEPLGKDVTVLSNDPVPTIVEFLKGAHAVRVVRTEEEAYEIADDKFDLGILVDVGFTERAGRAAPALESAATLAVFDHHEMGPKVSGDLRVIDASASATCYLLFSLFEDLGLAIDPAVADCLLTGIVTDTGCFRFGNTDPVSLHAAASLIERGADLARINEMVWNRRPATQIQMLQRAFDHLRLSQSNRLAVTHLSQRDYEATGAHDEDTEGIASEIARIGTVDVAAVFREAKAGHVRVSVRSRGDIDVAEVCRMFNGGGHKNAAGCTIDAGVEEAMARMVPALEACLA